MLPANLIAAAKQTQAHSFRTMFKICREVPFVCENNSTILLGEIYDLSLTNPPFTTAGIQVPLAQGWWQCGIHGVKLESGLAPPTPVCGKYSAPVTHKSLACLTGKESLPGFRGISVYVPPFCSWSRNLFLRGKNGSIFQSKCFPRS